ncbi:MAG: putative membrane protein, partial [Halobacteriales archaeon]
EEGEEAVVAVVSGAGESVVNADRSVARQMDELMAEYAPDSAIVVIDSAEDERLVPIVESRVRVDSVDRVVVRQARDIESTYYLLKQFLADEELRQTILVPIGVALVVFPALSIMAGPTLAIATITAVIGLFLLYKGFGIDERLTGLTTEVREALYSGQISVVTYVIAAGLTLGGVFAGALGVSSLSSATEGVFLPAMRFAFDSVPWLAMAALAASTGRVLDEAIQEESVPSAFLNLPFFAVAVGLVIRGFSGYFLERGTVIGSIQVPPLEIGAVTVEGFPLQAGERLAVFVLVGILVSIVGVQIASRLSGTTLQDSEVPETGS